MQVACIHLHQAFTKPKRTGFNSLENCNAEHFPPAKPQDLTQPNPLTYGAYARHMLV
jgi:hypothetical protein